MSHTLLHQDRYQVLVLLLVGIVCARAHGVQRSTACQSMRAKHLLVIVAGSSPTSATTTTSAFGLHTTAYLQVTCKTTYVILLMELKHITAASILKTRLKKSTFDLIADLILWRHLCCLAALVVGKSAARFIYLAHLSRVSS